MDNRKLWNEDGTPRRPDYVQDQETIRAFADLAAQAEGTKFANYAKLRAEAKRATPAGVGDIVHHWDGDGCAAAIVAGVGYLAEDPDLLFVINPNGGSNAFSSACHDEFKAEDTWHWPESL